MAVHNEHSLRSFPGFCENENYEDDYDDDDDDNHFVISLNESADEDDDQMSTNTAPVCDTLSRTPYNSYLAQTTSPPNVVSTSHPQHVSSISYSAFPAGGENRISAFPAGDENRSSAFPACGENRSSAFPAGSENIRISAFPAGGENRSSAFPAGGENMISAFPTGGENIRITAFSEGGENRSSAFSTGGENRSIAFTAVADNNIGISAYQQFVVSAPKINCQTEPSVNKTSNVDQWDSGRPSSTHRSLPVPGFLPFVDSGVSPHEGAVTTVSSSNGCGGSTFTCHTEVVQPGKSASETDSKQFYLNQRVLQPQPVVSQHQSFIQQHQVVSQHQSFIQQHQVVSQAQNFIQQHQGFSQQQQHQGFSQQQQHQGFSQQQQHQGFSQQHQHPGVSHAQSLSQQYPSFSQQHQATPQQHHIVSQQHHGVVSQHHPSTLTTTSTDSSQTKQETFQLDREAGVWSEAVFLPSVGTPDHSFPDLATADPCEYVLSKGASVAHDRCQTTSTIPSTSSYNLSSTSYFSTSCVPQLAVATSKSSEPCSITVIHPVPGSLVAQQIPPVDNTASCSCIMCYKGGGATQRCPGSYRREPALTREEKKLINNEPTKRKRQYKPAVNSKKKKATMLNSSGSELEHQPTSSLNCTQAQNILLDLSRPFSVHRPGLHTVWGNKSAQSITPDAPACGVLSSMLKSAVTPVVAAKTQPVVERETTPAQLTWNGSSPPMPSLVSAPLYKSNTKVFLQPSEALGQRSQSVLPELTPMNKVSSNVRVSLPSVTCKETQPPSPSLSSPPSYKIIYVMPDQVLVCPNKTRPATVLKPAQTSSQSTTDSSHGGHLATEVSQPCLSSIKSPSLVSKARNVLKNVLKNAEKIDISKPGEVLIKLQKPSNNEVLIKLQQPSNKSCPLQTSQTKTISACTPAPISSVYTTSLLKDFKLSPAKSTDSTITAISSQASSVTTHISLSPVASKPSNHTVTMHTALSTVASKPSNHTVTMHTALSTVASKPSNHTVTMHTALSPVASKPSNHTITMRTDLSPISSKPLKNSVTPDTASPPVASKPSNQEVMQALMCLIKSHIQGQTSAGSESMLLNLIRGSIPASGSNSSPHKAVPTASAPQHNIRLVDGNISNQLQKAPTDEPLKDRDKLRSPGRNIPDSEVIYVDLDRTASPSLPEEGLPSSYVEDWVKHTQTYVPENLDYLPELHNRAVDPHAASTPSQDVASQQHDDIKYHINADMKSSILEETVHPKLGPPNQLLCSEPFTVSHNHEVLLSSSTSYPPTVKITSSCQNSVQRQVSQPSRVPVTGQNVQSLDQPSRVPVTGQNVQSLDQPSRLPVTGQNVQSLDEPSRVPVTGQNVQSLDEPSRVPVTGQNVQSFSMERQSQAVKSDPQRLPYSKSSTQSKPMRAGPGLPHNGHTAAVSTAATSVVVGGSKGIKLKIKLGEASSSNSCSTGIEAVNEPQTSEEFSLQKRLNLNHQEFMIDGAKEVASLGGDINETAEEMFQRFQKQAEQQVLKAQMGLGCLSRSLRPTRTNAPPNDKCPFVYGTGQPRKKVTSDEKQVCDRSKQAGDNSSCCSLSELEEQSSKSGVRSKRPSDEVISREVRLKQPKVSIKDYPRLKQDNSITNRKKLVCPNILAGHKVYVKFNTYESAVSGRVFLVPFFNIGGTRTQFDVEDMHYINKAVLEFERDERSCARHLIFYAREGQKASFLRKELQASHIEDKNYRKTSFILEGFQRDNRKQTDPSPEHWQVDSTVDIEIDRAEVDNDAEVEFGLAMDYHDDFHGRHIYEEENIIEHALHLDQDGDFSHSCADEPARAMVFNELVEHSMSSGWKACAQRGRGNREDLHTDKLHQEIEKHSHMATLAPAASDSALSSAVIMRSGNPSVLTNKYSDGDKQRQGHLAKVTTSRVLGNGSQDILGSASCWPLVKQEEPDTGYETNPNVAQSACLTLVSAKAARNPCDQLIDKFNITVKREPVDDCFDSQAGMKPCSSESVHIEHSDTLSYQHPPPRCVAAKGSTSLSAAGASDQLAAPSALSPPADDSHDPMAAPCVLLHHPVLSGSQITDSTCTPKTEMPDPEGCQSELSQTGVSADFTSGVACDSSPKSPLPLRSPSASSYSSSSSDMDDTQASTETASLTAEMPVPEGTTHDGTSQGNDRSKIMSLVESLRSRLTQDTCGLPPWLANTETEEKKKKRLKVKANNSAVKLGSSSESTPSQSSPMIPSSLPCPTAVTLDQALPQPVSLVTPYPTDSDPLATICPPSLPQDILKPVAAPSPNKNPMMLPVLQPTGQSAFMRTIAAASQGEPSMVDCTSHGPVGKFEVSETQTLTVADGVDKFPPIDPNISVSGSKLAKDFQDLGDRWEHMLLDIGHSDCSEMLDSFRQSPIDFEIEVGEEDLPETALSLQPILPSSAIILQQSDEDYHDEDYHVEPYNASRTGKAASMFASQRANRTKQSEPDKALSEMAQDSRLEKGSVASYLSEKFKFTGAGHKIKGPRLLHMRPSSMAEQKSPKPSASKTSIVSEPITVMELSKSPSVVEIFGASLGNKAADTHKDSLGTMTSSSTEQGLLPAASSRPANTNRKARKRTAKKKTSRLSGGSKLRTAPVESKLVPDAREPASTQLPSSVGVARPGPSSKLMLEMPACRVVLTRLNIGKQVDHVFIVKPNSQDTTPTAQAAEPEKLPEEDSATCSSQSTARKPEKLPEEDSATCSSQSTARKPEKLPEEGSATCSSQSTARKVLKKKRKKNMKVTKRPAGAVRPKRDIVDYYAFMLENLQKKAQLLEEESKRIAEEQARMSATVTSEVNGMTEMDKSSNQRENNEERENNCEEVRMKEIKEQEKSWGKVEEGDKHCDEVQQRQINCEEVKEQRQISCQEVNMMKTEEQEKCCEEVEEKGEREFRQQRQKSCEEVEEQRQKSCEEVEEQRQKSCEEVEEQRQKSCEEVEQQRQKSYEAVKRKEVDSEIETTNKCNVEKVSNMQTEVDLPSHVAICSSRIGTCSATGAVHSSLMASHASCANSDCRLSLECGMLGRAIKLDALGLTDHVQFPTEVGDFGLQSEVSDSNWAFLQKFCDETILDEDSTDCLRKLPENIDFPRVAAVAGLRFGKKDIVLACSVAEEAEALGTSEILEDTDCCLQDDQERDSLDGMLLSMDIQRNPAFGHEDEQETGKDSFSLSLPSQARHKPLHTGIESSTNVESVELSPREQETAANMNGLLTSSSEPNHTESREPVFTREAVNLSESREPVVTREAVNVSESREPVVTREAVNGDLTPPQPLKHRNVEVSPSWERLLGQPSIEKCTEKSSSSRPQEPVNQNVSFVASTNFKGKFKLPKGILSKAIMMSRDMRNTFDKAAAKESSLVGNLEVDGSLTNPEVAVHQGPENNAKNNSRLGELSQSVDSSLESVVQTCHHSTIASPVPATGASLSPVAPTVTPATGDSLNPVAPTVPPAAGASLSPVAPTVTPEAGASLSPVAPTVTPATGASLSPVAPTVTPATGASLSPVAPTVTPAVAESSPVRKRGRKPKKKRPIARSLPHTVGAQSDDDPAHLRTDELSLGLDHGSLDEPHQNLLPGTLDEPCQNLLPGTLDEPRQNLLPGNARSSFEVSGLLPDLANCDLKIKEGIPLPCSKLRTTDGAAFNQLNQEPVTQAKNIRLAQTVLPASPSISEPNNECVKQNRNDGIFSNIDFLCDFSGEQAAKSLSGPPPQDRKATVNKMIKNGVIDIRKLKLKLNPLITSKLKQKALNMGGPSVQEGSSPVLKKADPLSTKGLNTPECASPFSVNVLQSVDSIETSCPDQQLLHPSTESTSHTPLPTNKRMPVVNAAKLCNFLKNFHKTSMASGTVQDVRVCSSEGGPTSSSSSVNPAEMFDELSAPASTPKIESNIKGRKRGRKAAAVPHTTIVKMVRGIRMAKQKANKNILTGSPKKGLHDEQLNNEQLNAGQLTDEHRQSGGDDGLKNEDKGERSFFDCLPSVPLHAWEDKQES